jgi:lipoic acid synthetase
MIETANERKRLPHWLKSKIALGEHFIHVKDLTITRRLNTICVSGNCPNRGECWSNGTATFMILGNKCTRSCGFCMVTTLHPDPVEEDEPERVALSIRDLKLKHAVLTSVARDDLRDGGAGMWVKTILKVKELNPGLTMEVLIPDFRRGYEVYDRIIESGPEVISHNLETVRRLTHRVRSLARFENSLNILRYISSRGVTTKTGIMVGHGETAGEVIETMQDAYNAGVKVFTIGQYMQPSGEHLEVVEYIKPEIFEKYYSIGKEIGFRHVESSPLVRSSYHAEKHVS